MDARQAGGHRQHRAPQPDALSPHWRTRAPPSEHDAGNGAAVMRLLPAALATFGLAADTVRDVAAWRAQAHPPPAPSDAACLTLTGGMVHALLAGADKNRAATAM